MKFKILVFGAMLLAGGIGMMPVQAATCICQGARDYTGYGGEVINYQTYSLRLSQGSGSAWVQYQVYIPSQTCVETGMQICIKFADWSTWGDGPDVRVWNFVTSGWLTWSHVGNQDERTWVCNSITNSNEYIDMDNGDVFFQVVADGNDDVILDSVRVCYTALTVGTPTLVLPTNGATCVPALLTLFEWNDVTNADLYEITIIGVGTYQVSSSQYIHFLPLNPFWSYSWKVRARRTFDGCSVWGDWSATWSFTTTGTPSAPTLSSPSNGATCVVYNPTSFNWGDVSGATSYEIEIPGVGTYTRTTSDASITLSANTTYQWRVRAYRCNWSSWTSYWSFNTNDPVSAPSWATATDGDASYCNQVHIEWAVVSGADRYKLLRGSTLVDEWIPGTSYNDAGGNCGQTYTYKVYAHNDCGWSSSYASNTGWKLCVPDAPSSVNASDGSGSYCNSVHITWSSVSGADRYKVLRGNTLLSDQVSCCSYDDDEGNCGQTYTYKVYANNTCGWSTNYGSNDGWMLCGPIAPSNVSASDNTNPDYIEITWYDNSSNETGFRIYRDNNPTPLITLPAGTISWRDSSATGVHTYCVFSYNNCGEAPDNPTDDNCDQGSVLPIVNVSGTIQFNNWSCPDEGIHIYFDDDEPWPPIVTDSQGHFTHQLTQGEHEVRPDTLGGHVFYPPEFDGMISTDTSLFFEDLKVNSIHGIVSGSCGYSIGQAQVVIRATDRCDSVVVMTDPVSHGYSASVPPQHYQVSVTVPGTPIEFATQEVDMTAGHDTTLNFIYHHPIEIEFVGFPDPETGCDIPVLQQMQTYNITIRVFERFDEGLCYVDSGEVHISDYIGDQEDTVITLELDANGSAYYTLTAGEPNILWDPDHAYQKQFEVHALVGDRDTSLVQWVYVEGHKPRAETFVTTTPELPFLILRDPPGDQSYGRLAESWSTCLGNSFFYARDTTQAHDSTWKFGWAVGDEFGVPFDIQSVWQNGTQQTGGVTTSGEFSVCLSTETEYRTAEAEDLPGSESDVYGGCAINMLYAVTDVLTIGEGCAINIDQSIAWTANGVETSFLYTDAYIRNELIPLMNWHAQHATNPDSAQYFLDSRDLWQNILDLNDSLKQAADFVENRSFNSGPQWCNSTTTTISQSLTIQFYPSIDRTVAEEGHFYIAGKGWGIEHRTVFHFQTGASLFGGQSHSSTVGYCLQDNDTDNPFFDHFSVDIKSDPVYGTPVFDLLGGNSSCPWEHPTAPREGVTISTIPTEQNNVDPASAAVFTANLGNTNMDENRFYDLCVIQESNPHGALIKINSIPIEDCVARFIPHGQVIQQLLTVERDVSPYYSFPDLKVSLTSICGDAQIANTAKFSVFFRPPCSMVHIAEPDNNWLVNQLNHDTLDVVLTNYDETLENLERIDFQYTAHGQSDWTTAHSIPKAELPPDNVYFPWDVSYLPDGEYDIRARSVCQSQQYASDSLCGLFDRSSPQVFGTPEPTDGVLDPGDNISCVFTEPINCSTANSICCSLRCADNGASVAAAITCNGTSIMIMPQVNYGFIEDRQLIASLHCITDLHGNMVVPTSWSFWVNMSPLCWNPIMLAASVDFAEPLIFASDLMNRSTQAMSFTITDCPSWITPSDSSGQILPGNSQTVQFTINTVMGAGVYRDTVYAVSGSWHEPLFFEVEILGGCPNWQVVPGLQYQMDVYASAEYCGQPFTGGSYNKLAAFGPGGESDCRGIGEWYEYGPDQFWYIPVMSNAGPGTETIAFMLCGGASGTVSVCNETVLFADNTTIGDIAAPFPLTACGGDPYTPSNPNPTNGAIEVPLSAILSWTGGDPDSGDTVTYDVYFGMTTPPPNIVMGQSDTTYDPVLVESTTYYWKIVSHDNDGHTTEGPIWSFATEEGAPPTPWWNPDWGFRKLLCVSDAPQSYPMCLTVYKENGHDDTGGVVDCENHCNADFSDLRFVLASTQTELSYWIEETGTDNGDHFASVWVSAFGGDSTYLYYGNLTTSTTSSGLGTFDYFDHWTTDNTGNWIHGVPATNHHQWWENTKSFISYRALESKSKMVSWNYGTWDWTTIGWSSDKTSHWSNVDHVMFKWSMRTSDGASNSIVRVQLSTSRGGTITTTSFKSVPRPDYSHNLSLSLAYDSSIVRFEWKDLDAGTMLASDSITDPLRIPLPGDVRYLMHEEFDLGGGIHSWLSPTELHWGNKPQNGGCEWHTDYWFVRDYRELSPTWCVFGQEEDHCLDRTPLAPQITIGIEGQSARLRWKEITESVAGCPIPVEEYDVYGADSCDGTYEYLATVTSDTTYLDTDAFSTTFMRFYYVVAVGSQGQLSLTPPHTLRGLRTDHDLRRPPQGRIETGRESKAIVPQVRRAVRSR